MSRHKFLTSIPCDNCGILFLPKSDKNRFHSRKCQLQSRNSKSKKNTNSIHFVIPDTQCAPGTPIVHLKWIGQYIYDKSLAWADSNITVVHLGDHWDMPSLSSYDHGKKSMEGRRYLKDVEYGNKGFALLNEKIGDLPIRRVFLFGNHEERIVKAAEFDAQLDGLLSLDSLLTPGWERYPFLVPVEIDGVVYSHYFYQPMSGRPYSGENVKLRLKTIGHSFTMGHQQTLDYAIRFVNGKAHQGLVAGSAYLHDETYKGPQGNAHWRGIIVCHNVNEGSYDPMFISLDYLCRRYEKMPLSDFMAKKKIARVKP